MIEDNITSIGRTIKKHPAVTTTEEKGMEHDTHGLIAITPSSKHTPVSLTGIT